jgi:hypothetical protein
MTTFVLVSFSLFFCWQQVFLFLGQLRERTTALRSRQALWDSYYAGMRQLAQWVRSVSLHFIVVHLLSTVLKLVIVLL